MKKILHNIRQHLNDIALITLIAVIGLMLGVTYQHCLVVKDISELEQKVNILLDQEGDIVLYMVLLKLNVLQQPLVKYGNYREWSFYTLFI